MNRTFTTCLLTLAMTLSASASTSAIQTNITRGSELLKKGKYTAALPHLLTEIKGSKGAKRILAIKATATCYNALNRLEELNLLLDRESGFLINNSNKLPYETTELLTQKMALDKESHRFQQGLACVKKLLQLQKEIPHYQAQTLSELTASFCIDANLFFTSDKLNALTEEALEDYKRYNRTNDLLHTKLQLHQKINSELSLPPNYQTDEIALNKIINALKNHTPLEAWKFCRSYERAIAKSSHPIKPFLMTNLILQLIEEKDNNINSQAMDFYRRLQPANDDLIWYNIAKVAHLLETKPQSAHENMRMLITNDNYSKKLFPFYIKATQKLTAIDLDSEALFWRLRILSSKNFDKQTRFKVGCETAHYLTDLKHHEKALDVYKKILPLASSPQENNFCIRHQVEVLKNLDKHQEAISALNQIDPRSKRDDYFQAIFYKITYAREKRSNGTLVLIEDFLKENNAPDELWSQTSNWKIAILREKNEWQKLTKAYHNHAQRLPGDNNSLEYLWRAAKINLLQLNNEAECLKILEKIKGLAANKQPSWFLKSSRLEARILYDNPTTTESIWRAVWEQPGIAGSSFELEVTLEVGQALWRQNKKDKALALIKRAWSLIQDNDHQQASLLLHVLPELTADKGAGIWPLPTAKTIANWQLNNTEKLNLYRALCQYFISKDQLINAKDFLNEALLHDSFPNELNAHWSYMHAELLLHGSNFSLEDIKKIKRLQSSPNLSRFEKIKSTHFAIDMAQKLNQNPLALNIALEVLYREFNDPASPKTKQELAKILHKASQFIPERDPAKEKLNLRMRQQSTSEKPTQFLHVTDRLIDNAKMADEDGFADTAQALLQHACQISPDRETKKLAIGQLLLFHIKKQQWQKAIDTYEYCDLKEPAELKLLFTAANFAQGNTAQTIDTCRDILEVKPTDKAIKNSTLLLQAFAFIKEKNFAAANNNFTSIYNESDSKAEKIKLSLFSARACLLLGNPVSSESFITQSKENGATDLQTLYLEIWTFLQRGNAEGAFALYSQNYASFEEVESAGKAELIIELSRLLLEKKEDKKAGFLITQAHKNTEDKQQKIDIKLMQAEFFLAQLQQDMATKIFEEILAKNDIHNRTKIQYRLAGLYTLPKPLKATEIYSLIIENSENTNQIRFDSSIARADIYLKEDKLEQAQMDFMRAATLADNEKLKGQCFFLVARTLAEKAHIEKDHKLYNIAASFYSKAASCNGEIALAAKLLQAQSLTKSGNHAKAEETFSELCKSHPKDRNILYYACRYNIERQNYKRAMELIKKLEQNSPKEYDLEELAYLTIFHTIFESEHREIFKSAMRFLERLIAKKPDQYYNQLYSYLQALHHKLENNNKAARLNLESLIADENCTIQEFAQYAYALILSERESHLDQKEGLKSLLDNYSQHPESSPGLESLYQYAKKQMLAGFPIKAQKQLFKSLFKEDNIKKISLGAKQEERLKLLYSDSLSILGQYGAASKVLEENDNASAPFSGRYADMIRLQAATERNLSKPETLKNYEAALRKAANIYEEILTHREAEMNTIMKARCYYAMGFCYEQIARHQLKLSWNNELLKAKQAYNQLLKPVYAKEASYYFANAGYNLNRIFLQLENYNSAKAIQLKMSHELKSGAAEAKALLTTKP